MLVGEGEGVFDGVGVRVDVRDGAGVREGASVRVGFVVGVFEGRSVGITVTIDTSACNWIGEGIGLEVAEGNRI